MSALVPPQRLPTPTLEGQAIPVFVTVANPISVPIASPRVGTAWFLSGFSINMNAATIHNGGGSDPVTAVIELLLGGQPIDAFVFDVPLAGGPLGQAQHFYLSPFLIYDTNSLQLRFSARGDFDGYGYGEAAPGEAPASGHYRGNLAYA